jgi:CrcB protein
VTGTAQSLALVGAGGALGSCARYALGRAVQHAAGGVFPWGTVAVNVLGCLAIGVLVPLLEARGASSVRWQLFLTTGVLGGFTTFSTFSRETVALLRAGHPGAASANAALSLAACVLATLAGWWAVAAVRRLG